MMTYDDYLDSLQDEPVWFDGRWMSVERADELFDDRAFVVAEDAMVEEIARSVTE
jgi:hypothetical protein